MSKATYQYRHLLPTTGRGTALSDADVDWDIPNEGMDIQYSSIYITGKLVVSQKGQGMNNPGNSNEDIRYNPNSGIHGFFRQFSCSAGGTIENLNNYGHIVTAMSESSHFYQELFSEIDKSMELRVGESEYTTEILKGQYTDDGAVAFAFKPLIAFNFSMDKNGLPTDLSFNSLGTMRIRGRLSSVLGALYGEDCSGANTSFQINDLELQYRVVPPAKVSGPTSFLIFNDTSRPVNSNNVNLNAQMPGLTSSFSSVYIPVVDEVDYKKDSYRTAVLPNVTRVQFAYNGNETTKIAFPLETREEIQYNYRLSLGNSGLNSLLLSSTNRPAIDNHGYGIGLNFGRLKSLIKTTFSLNILSGVSNVPPLNAADSNRGPYTAYMFFRSLVTI